MYCILFHSAHLFGKNSKSPGASNKIPTAAGGFVKELVNLGRCQMSDIRGIVNDEG